MTKWEMLAHRGLSLSLGVGFLREREAKKTSGKWRQKQKLRNLLPLRERETVASTANKAIMYSIWVARTFY